jgi:hypothetical protein
MRHWLCRLNFKNKRHYNLKLYEKAQKAGGVEHVMSGKAFVINERNLLLPLQFHSIEEGITTAFCATLPILSSIFHYQESPGWDCPGAPSQPAIIMATAVSNPPLPGR